MGFDLNEKTLRRASLDYIDNDLIQIYNNFKHFLKINENINLYGVSTKGKKYYHHINFKKNDFFIFGPETRGLPGEIRDIIGPDMLLRIPMASNNRSINLANTVSIVLYEAWRQNNFINGN